MATSTTRAGLVKPALTEAQDVAVLNSNADKIDSLLGATTCTSGTRPIAPFDGQFIHETDTDEILYYNLAKGRWVGIYEPTSPVELAYSAGWRKPTTSLNTFFKYWKTGKRVHVEGGIENSVAFSPGVYQQFTVGILPVGFRPPATEPVVRPAVFNIAGIGFGASNLRVAADGSVSFQAGPTAGGPYDIGAYSAAVALCSWDNA